MINWKAMAKHYRKMSQLHKAAFDYGSSVGDRQRHLLESAKYLLLSATGPEDGPTSWNDTRDEWFRRYKGKL